MRVGNDAQPTGPKECRALPGHFPTVPEYVQSPHERHIEGIPEVPVTPGAILSGAAAVFLSAAFALGGCATAPMEELAQAHATVASAAVASHGSADFARAEAKLALGRRLVNAHAYGPARWAVEQAQVDAELALAKSVAEEALRRAAMAGSSHTAGRPIAERAF